MHRHPYFGHPKNYRYPFATANMHADSAADGLTAKNFYMYYSILASNLHSAMLDDVEFQKRSSTDVFREPVPGSHTTKIQHYLVGFVY